VTTHKKIVLAALEAVAEGRLESATESLRTLDRAFLRGRLDHYLRHGTAKQESAAAILWKHSFPDPSHAGPNEATIVPVSAPSLGSQPLPTRIDLDAPEPFLAWLTAWKDSPGPLVMDTLDLAQVWGLVGLASACLPDRPDRPSVDFGTESRPSAARFAHAVGFDALVTGKRPFVPRDAERTVPLRRVRRYSEIESTADEMSHLIVPSGTPDLQHAAGEVRRSVKYVLVELLRNVIQHSEDPLGGVAAAQLMDRGPYVQRPKIQVAVADSGIGIPAHLRRMHEGLDDARTALERALWPHISGAFPAGLTGTLDNAGLGLFFIAETAKRSQGRLLVASRGAALVLAPRDDQRVVPRFLQPSAIGFPGTLVAFEVALDAVRDYAEMHRAIIDAARDRTPARVIHRWVRFELPPGTIERIRVADLHENTAEAAKLSRERISPAIVARRGFVLDFSSIEICTQSFLHALLYEALRLAWALRTPIYAVHAEGPVRSGIEFLESYALAG
jgi:hypothetical protein